MPSIAKAISTEEKSTSFLVAVKARGVGTKREYSPVRQRAKFAAARKVGVLADYIPNSLQDFKDVDVTDMSEGATDIEIETMKTLDSGPIQQTVLYGVRITK